MNGGILAENVRVTVTYEALNAAAAEAQAKAANASTRLEELKRLTTAMHAVWNGEAAETGYDSLLKRFEAVQERVAEFRSNAKNLEAICQNYVSAAGSIASSVQTLSDDVIV